MISWIKGDAVDLWQTNNKFYILINCNGLGYEVQILESIFIRFKSKQLSHNKIILWLKHIKKEDSDSLYGFISKDQKDFFIEILNVKGIGAQIGMALLNKFSINEIINAIHQKNKKLISSVPGIGQKMTDRLILELSSKLNTKFKIQEESKNNQLFVDNIEFNSILEDLNNTLESLNYPKREIKNLLPVLIDEINKRKHLNEKNNNISFEDFLKIAMNYLDKNNSNFVQ